MSEELKENVSGDGEHDKEILNILIAEDNRDDEFLLVCGLLKLDRPFSITFVHNLRNTAKQLRHSMIRKLNDPATSDGFDIVFLDLNLPDSSSYNETLELVTRHKSNHIFFGMSGTEDPARVRSAYDAGVEMFFGKEEFSSGHLSVDLERAIETCRSKKPIT